MQISEEEKTAIEIDLKCLHNVMNNFEDDLCERMQERVAEVKQFIEKQQAEYSDLKLKYEQGLLLHKKHVSDLEIKDKMIDSMSEEIFIRRAYAITSDDDIQRLKEEIIEEYRKKVENNESND